MAMIMKGHFIIPALIYPGDGLEAGDATKEYQANALLSAMESGWAEASYSLTRYLQLASDNEAVTQYFEKDKALWDDRAKHRDAIEKKYLVKNNVQFTDELSWEERKKMILEIESFDFNEGQPPRYWVTGLKLFYANRFGLAIDQIVLPLSLLSKYPEVIIDLNLFATQIEELKTLTCSKAIRDSMIHREDRLRGLDKYGREITGVPDDVMHLFTEDSAKPASVMVHSSIFKNHELTYTDWEGNQVKMPVRIDFFEEVERRVQGILENLRYKTDYPRLLKV